MPRHQPPLDPARPAWHVLWAASGHPPPAAAATSEGTCALCGLTGAVRRVRDVISDKWTGWEAYVQTPGVPAWCDPCAWAHSGVDRTRSWLITPNTAQPAGADLLDLLTHPLQQATVIVPVGRKKHLAPLAAWGHLITDDGPHPWTRAQAERFTALLALRSLGFGETALAAPSPAYERMRRLTPCDQATTFRLWPLLDPWRHADTTTFQAALLASRTPRKHPS